MTLIRGADPIWKEFDLSGHLFDDTYYLFVLENEIPYMPATVWQDPYGNVEWTSPIQFLANGTLPDNIYYDPDTIYRLEFRQGPTQDYPLIYLVENYVPGTGGSTPPSDVSFSTDNQISNPQFSVINFVSPFTLTSISTQVINFAPDWFLHLTGTGTVTLNQVTLNSTVENPTNASYGIQIQLSGSWTGAYLSQRFTQNGVLWSNTYVSSSLTALSGTPPESISSLLVDSMGNVLTQLLPSTTVVTTEFNEFRAVGQIGPSINTSFPPGAYIEYQIVLPPICNITLTSMQLIDGDEQIELAYEQTTIERQTDQLFHYYNPQLQYKPIPSYLIGWDFAFNPCQELGTSVTAAALTANTSRYIADQTIAFEAVSNVLSYGFNITKGLTVTCTTTASQFCIIQYLDASSAQELINNRMAVKLSTSYASSNALTCNVHLYCTTGATLPVMAVSGGYAQGNSLVATMTSGNPATFNAAGGQSWTEIPRPNAGPATFSLASTSSFVDQSFNGWDGTALGINPTFFAVVLSFTALTAGTNVSIRYCTLNKGDIATPPAPMNQAQTLQALQLYYETSYDYQVKVGTATTAGVYEVPQNTTVAAGTVFPSSFPIRYNSIKRSDSSTVTAYHPVTGTANSVQIQAYKEGGAQMVASATFSSNWTQTNPGERGTSFDPGSDASLSTVGGGTNLSGVLRLHYSIDARLGIV